MKLWLMWVLRVRVNVRVEGEGKVRRGVRVLFVEPIRDVSLCWSNDPTNPRPNPLAPTSP